MIAGERPRHALLLSALGAVALAAAGSLASGLPFVIVRSKPKQYGTGNRLEGAYEPGERVCLVEDIVTAGGALSGLSFELLDYIPAYRSPAGTGVGMAFATWNRDRAARTEQETAAS